MKIILIMIMGISAIYANSLTWQDKIVDKMYWEDAIEYCEALNLDGHSDWRLPNINELNSIVDRSQNAPQVLSEFENTVDGAYWSSTSSVKSKHYAWIVGFETGRVLTYTKGLSQNVRCVRGGE